MFAHVVYLVRLLLMQHGEYNLLIKELIPFKLAVSLSVCVCFCALLDKCTRSIRTEARDDTWWKSVH